MIVEVLAWLWLFITIAWNRLITEIIVLYYSITPIEKKMWKFLGNQAVECWEFREGFMEEWKEED